MVRPRARQGGVVSEWGGRWGKGKEGAELGGGRADQGEFLGMEGAEMAAESAQNPSPPPVPERLRRASSINIPALK